MKHRITYVDAMEILDSRGNPTVEVEVVLDTGVRALASVPSGASTGEFEAVELRDGDRRRYDGKGVRRAIEHIRGEIAQALHGKGTFDQREIDQLLIDLDGTPNKSRLGANAILGVSIAVARAAAIAEGQPLYRSFPHADRRLPMPMFNVLNGGKHADSSLDFQEFMLVPVGAPNFAEAVRYAAETFHAMKALLSAAGLSVAVGDEGGFAPRLESNDAACGMIVQAIEMAGYRPGEDISIALDPAATSFFGHDYDLSRSGEGRKTSAELIELYREWVVRYPIVSIEDGLAESDWDGFQAMTKALGDRIQIVGDDIFVTNTKFIRRGIEERTANAVLIKLNQIGTVSETMDAIALCRQAGWRYVVSHRSGETTDSFIADFTVAMGGGQLKSGSLCRGERIAKYNRLMRIEKELGQTALFANPFRPQ